MGFIIVLAVTTALAFLISKPLRKYPWVFYIAAVLLDVLYIASVYVSLPGLVKSSVFLLMQKCTFSLAFFMVVMYIGVFAKESKVSQMLRPVRAELSILACILAAGHMAVYLASYLPRFFSASILEGNFLLFFATAILLLVLLLVLGVTSFPAIKQRMDTTSWKKLQKWAYVFFGLIYVHLVTILLPSALARGTTAQISIAVYTGLFGLYAVLRIRRWYVDRKSTVLIAEPA